jgi:hypothetical protein
MAIKNLQILVIDNVVNFLLLAKLIYIRFIITCNHFLFSDQLSLVSLWRGPVVVVIVLYFDLQLPVQSVPFTSSEFEFRSWRGVHDTTLDDKVCQ